MTRRPLSLTLGLALALLASGAVAHANPGGAAAAAGNRHHLGEAFAPRPADLPRPPPPAAPAPAASDTAVEIVFWESVRDGDAAGFEAYLQQYPEGAFVPLARASLRRIEQADKTAETPSSALETQFDTLVEQDGVLVGRDCPECPEMVVVPAGSYRMGSRYGRTCCPSVEGHLREALERLLSAEEPVHEVTIGAPFAVGRYEVTFAEWDACARDGGCPRGEDIADDWAGWGRGRRPVINVGWDDAKRYVQWLSRKTGKPYRLLSESEWEYAARAGTETAYSWGDEIGVNRANCGGCGSRWGSKTVPVGSFGANAWGLYDMHGNVREWVEDCWNGSYAGSPVDGSAWLRGDCDVRVERGGSWNSSPSGLRAAFRGRSTTGIRVILIGFRVARTLAP